MNFSWLKIASSSKSQKLSKFSLAYIFQSTITIKYIKNYDKICQNYGPLSRQTLMKFMQASGNIYLVYYLELYQKGSQSCNQFWEFLPFTSQIAFFIASSASIEQCSFTGGNFKYFAMSEFLILSASSTFIPLMTSVAQELEAMAEPQPKVLKTAFSMVSPSQLSSIWSFITSPQAGAPTNPVPTFFLVLSREPTFLGFQQWSITLS